MCLFFFSLVRVDYRSQCISHVVVRFQSFHHRKTITRPANQYTIAQSQGKNGKDETKHLAFGSNSCGNLLILTSDSGNLSSQRYRTKSNLFFSVFLLFLLLNIYNERGGYELIESSALCFSSNCISS